MARPFVCRATSSVVLWGGPDYDEWSLDCGGWCCCSQPRRSDCRFLGRPGLHRVGERRRLLPVGATGSGSAEVVVDVAVDVGEVTRGLTWRVSPGEAGRVRRRGRMGADEEVEEASWGTVVEHPTSPGGHLGEGVICEGTTVCCECWAVRVPGVFAPDHGTAKR